MWLDYECKVESIDFFSPLTIDDSEWRGEERKANIESSLLEKRFPLISCDVNETEKKKALMTELDVSRNKLLRESRCGFCGLKRFLIVRRVSFVDGFLVFNRVIESWWVCRSLQTVYDQHHNKVFPANRFLSPFSSPARYQPWNTRFSWLQSVHRNGLNDDK